MNFLDRVKQIKNGAGALVDWLGDGAIPVSRDESQARADICLACPKNVKDWPLLESVASAIKAQVGVKNHLRLRVKGEKNLHFCEICGCVMKLKVHVPIENIRLDETEKPLYPDHCWVKKES